MHLSNEPNVKPVKPNSEIEGVKNGQLATVLGERCRGMKVSIRKWMIKQGGNREKSMCFPDTKQIRQSHVSYL